MNKRVCEGCRFYNHSPNDGYGFCRRNPPINDGCVLPGVGPSDWCGEWRDKAVTPEQEQRRELVRRFAVAMVTNARYSPADAWYWAAKLVDAEPNSSEIPNS